MPALGWSAFSEMVGVARSSDRWRASVGLVSLVLVVSGCGGSGHRASPARTATISPPPVSPRAATFGANVDPLFMGGSGNVDRQLASAAAAGLGLARATPLWEFTEPGPPSDGRHRYDWSYSDLVAGRLAAHSFRWVALLAYTPGWASTTPTELHGAPVRPADYAAYAAAVAGRYRGRIAAYEIWNEENSSIFWRPAPDPAAYARLYLAARSAIHGVDPGVPVLIGGLANDGGRFLSELLHRPELQGHVDGVAVHPYGRDPAAVIAVVRDYRLQLRALGAGQVPLYVTEYGWATQPPSDSTYATAAQRGPYIGAVAERLLGSNCDVRMVVFYAWTTAQNNPGRDVWYGVASRDGIPNAGTTAVADTARTLAARVPASPTLPLCPA